jgi:hypothetical protein
LQLPQATTIEQAIKNIAFVSDLKATGKIDLDFADSLVADNRTILNALVEEQKLLLAQGEPSKYELSLNLNTAKALGIANKLKSTQRASAGHCCVLRAAARICRGPYRLESGAAP